MFLAVSQVYIEEVDFPVLRDDLAFAIDEHTRIVKLTWRRGDAFDDTATVNDHLMLPCLLLQPLDGRTRNSLSSFIKARVGAEIRPEFG